MYIHKSVWCRAFDGKKLCVLPFDDNSLLFDILIFWCPFIQATCVINLNKIFTDHEPLNDPCAWSVEYLWHVLFLLVNGKKMCKAEENCDSKTVKNLCLTSSLNRLLFSTFYLFFVLHFLRRHLGAVGRSNLLPYGTFLFYVSLLSICYF